MSGRYGLVVLDASSVVALLADRVAVGDWVAEVSSGRRLAAPWLMPFEVGNSLRRRHLGGRIDAAAAMAAHDALLSMPVDLWPHARVAHRAWRLGGALTYYDAAYVAVAEMLDAPLVTLDRRLTRAPGPTCAFLTPPVEL